ncbi:MAG: uroporphyrinogen decarboxylase family protein [Candidatus Abyssubacteria bacterium]
MTHDTMTPEERFQTVIGLGVPDRVPVAPMIYYFAAFYADITVHELWSNPDKYRFAIEKCFRELGPWDIYYPINPLTPEAYMFILPMKIRYPGIDLPPDNICQVIEEPIMTADEYGRFAKRRLPTPMLKYLDFLLTLACRVQREPATSLAAKLRILKKLGDQAVAWRAEFAQWRERGVAVQHGLCAEAPFDTFSMSRGVVDFSYDLMERPEELRDAALALSKGYVLVSTLFTRRTGVPRVLVFCHRTSNDFMSPKHFEEYALPPLKSIVEGLLARGITPILHCDGDWGKNLECMRVLPRAKVVLQFDGRTDIFRAKEIIGDHCCIFGDVPAAMLAFGGKEEVSDYCKKLIEVVGKDGGFVLGAGCEIPPNARPENVKAMIEAPKRFGYYG